MNKKELISELSARMHISQAQSKAFLNTFQDVLTETLKQESPLVLQGFGVFERWNQSERIGRNPRNGVSCMIRPRTSVKFKPGKGLLELLNS